MRSNLIQIPCSIDEVTKDQISELSQLSLHSVGDRYGTQHQPPDCPLGSLSTYVPSCSEEGKEAGEVDESMS